MSRQPSHGYLTSIETAYLTRLRQAAQEAVERRDRLARELRDAEIEAEIALRVERAMLRQARAERGLEEEP